MRLIILLLTTAIIQVSASTYGQNVTLKQSNTSLVNVFTEIRKQTGFDFFYSDKMMDSARPISVNLKNVPLEQVLKEIFENQPLEYELKENKVIVSRKELSFLDKASSVIQSLSKDLFQSIDVRGVVVDRESGLALVGASVKVKGANNTTITGSDGAFYLPGVDEQDLIVVSFIGYVPHELKAKKDLGEIKLITASSVLEEVNVTYSTGYQNIPKERTTGSFGLIDNKIFNQQVSSDVLTRLEGATPGLLFNQKKFGNLMDVYIRGRATFGVYTGLVIVDNFPYEGNLANINPNDVESVTILKDAVAASIWGSKAGNGVIVITTKKGKYNRKPNIQISTNISTVDKNDLYNKTEMPVGDYVEFEKILFANGMYNSREQSVTPLSLSPVVELLIAKRDGVLSASEAEMKINQLSQNDDIRKDYLKYVYRPEFIQRHSANISGGGSNYLYYVSGGYDKTQKDRRGNSSDRISLNFNNTFSPVKFLELSAGVNFSKNRDVLRTNVAFGANSAYEKLVDENGNATSVISDYRTDFKENASRNGLLDWQLKPYNEINKYNQNTDRTDYVVNAGLKISPFRYLNFHLLYQSERETNDVLNNKSKDLYEVRTLINKFTQINGSEISRPIPIGDIFSTFNRVLNSQSLRGQINFNHTLGTKHSISSIVGYEFSDKKGNDISNTIYGYNEKGLTSSPVNYTTLYRNYFNPGLQSYIPYESAISDEFARAVSFYGNGAYSFDGRINLSGSFRKDGSNIFGVNTNQKWNPFWSTGISWELSKEQFYNFNALPSVKLRVTYGVTGNSGLGRSTAYTTAEYGQSALTGLQFARITSPANPDLRWEKQKTANFGIDFSLINDVVSGSIEYYIKKGIDLFNNAPLDPTTGFFLGTNYTVNKNYASMVSRGMDIELNTKNVDRNFKWTSRIIFSLNKNKVVKLDQVTTISSYFNDVNGAIVLDKPFGMLYSYKWQGLDSNNGNPIGILDGSNTTDYNKIISNTKSTELIENGQVSPPVFGSLGNTLSWRSITLNFSMLFKFGHVFRRESFLYDPGNRNVDFSKRWMKTGDELSTDVPSIPSSFSSNRNLFYRNSEVLVERGDLIRLQFITLNYEFAGLKGVMKWAKTVNVYANFNNLGLLWRANDKGLDPDYPIFKSLTSYSFGIKATF